MQRSKICRYCSQGLLPSSSSCCPLPFARILNLDTVFWRVQSLSPCSSQPLFASFVSHCLKLLQQFRHWLPKQQVESLSPLSPCPVSKCSSRSTSGQGRHKCSSNQPAAFDMWDPTVGDRVQPQSEQPAQKTCGSPLPTHPHFLLSHPCSCGGEPWAATLPGWEKLMSALERAAKPLIYSTVCRFPDTLRHFTKTI